MIASKKILPYAVYTGLFAGILNLGGAIVNYMISHGQFPYKILEYIASGAFGKTAMNGSLGSNLWGLFFHYFSAYKRNNLKARIEFIPQATHGGEAYLKKELPRELDSFLKQIEM